MTNRMLLESVVANFSPHKLTNFFRAACGSFRPGDRDYSHYLSSDLPVDMLHEIGQIQFPDERRLLVVIGQMQTELTSRSGKKKQYDLAKKILKDELYDAGIFAFCDQAGHFRFSLVVAQYLGRRRSFSNFRRYTYFVSPGPNNRTFLDQIGQAEFDSIENILEAFSVEVVTEEFFQQYEKIFIKAEDSISLDWNTEQKRLYTQRFFNRLIFLAFLERKGWLVFNGRQDYLRSMFEDYLSNDPDKRPDANFHRKRLNTLFFWGLNNPRGDERDLEEYEKFQNLIGEVPYLNGGLFEKEADDETWFFPDEIILEVLTNLIYRFNFTVAESTPLDIEVAVDPEMLGKIFEEMVTGRHESGSYYTPKPVVSFMCREAIKGYLKTNLADGESEAIHQFVDETDPTGLRNPESVLTALQGVRACDPACGSGAYLLGLLHELLDLRAALFAVRNIDAQTVYDRKLAIIQNNLYGVDIDPFAVNIARLRLWLSLIVDFEGDDPPPLPNLDFKIETGDSLTAPDPSGGLQPDMFRYNQVQKFLRLKNEFMTAHSGSDKKRSLSEEIEALRNGISEWAHPDSTEGFDWAVDFAEIFAPQLAAETLGGKMTGVVNGVPGQMELVEQLRSGGFDIVLANPPYGATVKKGVRDIYFNPKTERGQSKDTYGLFMARALQLLRKEGQFCFIVSDTWRTIESHKPLRKKILKKTTVAHVLDLPSWIFNATVNTSILTLSKKSSPDNHSIIVSELKGIKTGNWRTLTDNLNAVASRKADMQSVEFARYTYPQKLIETFDNLSFFMGKPSLYKMMSNKSLVQLGKIAEIKYGVRTGNNSRFFLQRPNVRGNYKDITPFLNNVLTDYELKNLTTSEMLNGISMETNKNYIVPLNKGGESNVAENWLPKYYVPTGYYFDWSEEAVSHLKKIKGMRNPEIHFKKGLTFSWTGKYAPTFRVAHLGVYDQSSSAIQNIQIFSIEELLGILNSKLVKYQIKNYIDHTVNSDIGVISSVALPIDECLERSLISDLVKKILKKQMKNKKYDFSQEEKEIDSLVYKMFGLDKKEILDVENWYKRRYPKLA